MNPKRIAHSLVTRLIFFGVVLVTFGAATRYYIIPKLLRQDLLEVVSTQQVALAGEVALNIDDKVEQRRRLLERLAVTLPRAFLGQPGRLHDWLEERRESQSLFSLGYTVVDLSGKVLVDVPSIPGRIGVSIADDPTFRAARQGRWVIGRPMTDPATGQPMLPMAAPVKGAEGKLRAVLVGVTALAAPGFLDRLQQQRIGESGGFLLVAPRDKLIVARSNPAAMLEATPPADVDPLYDRAMAGFRGSGVSLNAQGVEEVSAMASVPSTGWFVVASVPTAEALAVVGRIQSVIIRYGLAAIVFLLLVAGLLINWMLRPLYRAADQADRMTLGEIPLKPLLVVRDDEVGHLTTAFNRLLAKLTSSQAELEHVAHHDALTGLPNRNLLADRMEQALARAQRNHTRLAVLFLDLNDFKLINDTLGHEAGDETLKEVARRLLAVLRHADTLARFGGDEFVLLATDLDERAEDGARTLAAKCIEAVAQPLPLRGGMYTLGVSVGIALCNGSCSADALLVAADKAMYAAKQQGRAGYVMAPPCDDLRAAART